MTESTSINKDKIYKILERKGHNCINELKFDTLFSNINFMNT